MSIQIGFKEIIEPYIDDILYRISIGYPMTAIVGELQLPLNATQARVAIAFHWHAEYAEAKIQLAHHIVEQTVVSAERADTLGEAAGYRAASDIRLKVAALLSPDDYLDKKRLELTGRDGGPIESSDLSPDEAYKQMLKGAAK
jgi:hypothetical protein